MENGRAGETTGPVDLHAFLLAATSGSSGVRRLVAEFALRFVVVDRHAFDESVVTSLRQIAEVLQVEQALLWRTCADGPRTVASHSWPEPLQGTLPGLEQLASIPFVASGLAAGEAAWFNRIEEVPDPLDRAAFLRHGLRSAAFVPVLPGEAPGVRRALAFISRETEHEWTPATIDQLRHVSGVLGHALARHASSLEMGMALTELERVREQDERALEAAHAEVRRLRDQLDIERVELRREVRRPKTPRMVATESPSARRVHAQIEQVAPTTATVLMLGETGSGKEVFAEALHKLSPRRNKPMVRVNCAAIPTSLIESELFGRERGAYTGALSRQIGRFEVAEDSTVFLDEVGELPLEVQVKLLRVLQDRVIERLGSSQPIKVNVRVIAATNRDLERAVADGTFREDLYYRLNVFPIRIPPLRERIEDIPTLVWAFIDEFASAFGKHVDSLSPGSLHALQAYAWPGNIRELRNVVERAMITATGPRLVIEPPSARAITTRKSARLSDVEADHIRAVLDSTGWRVRGDGGAAALLGMKPTSLESRMARLGIVRRARSWPVASAADRRRTDAKKT